MTNKIALKIGGAAGQGVKTSGYILTKALKDLGHWTFSYSEYPSLIRGGHSTFQINIDERKIHSVTAKIDILVALNIETIKLHYKEIKESGILLCDNDFEIPSEVKKYLDENNIKHIKVTVEEIVKKHNGKPVMNNSVITGAVWALLTSEYKSLENKVNEIFKEKSKDIQTNLNCTKDGFELVKNGDYPKFELKAKEVKNRILGTGNEVAGLATYASGCRLYCAYPMTPSTGILHYLAQRADKFDMIVKQAEDEITAVQMTIGGSFAGTRSACGTSGGGLALMTESLSLIGMIETPVVIFDSQRPGPATGTPTWTEQGDLDFVSKAGHGEFPRIIIAPGDIDEVFELVPEAFNLAEKYQTLVIILLDKFLSESWYQTDKFSGKDIKVEREGLLSQEELNKQKDFERYALTDSGISPRSIPGQENGVYCANSDEHDGKGYSTEDLDLRNKMMEKRMKKLDGIKSSLPEPELFGDKDAKTTVVCWGSQKGPVLDAVNELNSNGKSINMLHFSYVFPLKTEKLSKLAKENKLIAVENNFAGQLAKIIKEEAGIDVKERVMKYDGTPFFTDELVDILSKKIN